MFGSKIAICGGMRAGKDTVAEYLVNGYGYTRFAFGDELKRYAHELFGVSNAKPRELYQWFGQTMRERDPNIWVRKLFDKVRKITPVNLPLLHKPVITDLRQPNEYEALRAEGYVIVRINAADDLRIKRIQSAGDDFKPENFYHDTEQHYKSFAVDFEITNDGTLGHLYDQIDLMMKWLAADNGGDVWDPSKSICLKEKNA